MMDVDRRDFLKASTVGAFAGQLAASPLFPGFATRKVETSGATINVVHGGSGPPLLLIHGYPQTHVEWHQIAGRLAERFTVVMTTCAATATAASRRTARTTRTTRSARWRSITSK